MEVFESIDGDSFLYLKIQKINLFEEDLITVFSGLYITSLGEIINSG